jgi:hypothetical protein
MQQEIPMNDYPSASGRRFAFGAGLLIIVSLVTGLAWAASVPVWLDDAITAYNEKSSSIKIQFMDIKDSFVWYVIPDSEEIGSKDIREGIFRIAQASGYQVMEGDELITTTRPPTPGRAHTDKKCWKRSFAMEGEAPRVLTTYVCQGDAEWYAGFRTLQ